MKRDFKTFISSAREHLKKHGLARHRFKELLTTSGKRFVVAELARDAYDSGIPLEQGPVWFGDEEWKTEFWKRQWEWQKAYHEGEKARADFEGRESNPYRQIFLPFTSRLIELETCWNRGFNGDEL